MTLRPPVSQVGAELNDALAALRSQLSPSSGREAGRAIESNSLIAAYDAARAADLLMREHFRGVRERLGEVGAGGEVMVRLDAAEAAYALEVGGVLDSFATTADELRRSQAKKRQDAPAGLAAFRDRLDTLLEPVPQPILRGGVLPYRRASLATRSPRLEPAIVPSYLDPQASSSTGVDLAATPEAPLDDEILELAATFDHDYIRIYEFVRNEIVTEWYAGSRKGASGTLHDRSGNDIDQASLLIALFRAANLASRYVHGVLGAPGRGLGAELRPRRSGPGARGSPPVRYSARAGDTRRTRGRGPHRAHLGYGLRSLRQLPRCRGRLFRPVLDPAGAGYPEPRAAAADRCPCGRWSSTLTLWLPLTSTHRPSKTCSPTYEARSKSGCRRTSPGATYEEQLGDAAVVPQNLGLLPSTLPAVTVAVTGESASLSDEYRVRLRFTVHSGVTEESPVALQGELTAGGPRGTSGHPSPTCRRRSTTTRRSTPTAGFQECRFISSRYGRKSGCKVARCGSVKGRWISA